eukprot:4340054-Pleurochrysis_carterae.AAC.1
MSAPRTHMRTMRVYPAWAREVGRPRARACHVRAPRARRARVRGACARCERYPHGGTACARGRHLSCVALSATGSGELQATRVQRLLQPRRMR